VENWLSRWAEESFQGCSMSEARSRAASPGVRCGRSRGEVAVSAWAEDWGDWLMFRTTDASARVCGTGRLAAVIALMHCMCVCVERLDRAEQRLMSTR